MSQTRSTFNLVYPPVYKLKRGHSHIGEGHQSIHISSGKKKGSLEWPIDQHLVAEQKCVYVYILLQ